MTVFKSSVALHQSLHGFVSEIQKDHHSLYMELFDESQPVQQPLHIISAQGRMAKVKFKP